MNGNAAWTRFQAAVGTRPAAVFASKVLLVLLKPDPKIPAAALDFLLDIVYNISFGSL
jgi:hypothetical protein